MASKYTKADSVTYEILSELISEKHQDLHTAGVSIDMLFAYAPENDAGERTSTALKLHGYACNAITRIVNLRNRVMGRGDAEIELDGDIWPELTDRQRLAILDHELSHLVVSRNVQGEMILDSHSRPKLKMVLHDYHIGGFSEVAKRWGIDSSEISQIRAVMSSKWITEQLQMRLE